MAAKMKKLVPIFQAVSVIWKLLRGITIKNFNVVCTSLQPQKDFCRLFLLLLFFMFQSRKRPPTHLLTGGLAIRKLQPHYVKRKIYSFLYVSQRSIKQAYWVFSNLESLILCNNLSIFFFNSSNKFYILLTSSNNQISEFRIPNIYN